MNYHKFLGGISRKTTNNRSDDSNCFFVAFLVWSVKPLSHECRNQPECRRNENSNCILWQSKCILKLVTEFRVHSKYSGTFLWLVGMFCSCSKLSRCIRSEKITNDIRSAFELHSHCILNSLTAFQQHSKHSGLIRGTIDMASHFKSCQNVPSGPTLCTNSSNMAGSILR